MRPAPRWGHGKAPLASVAAAIEKGRPRYAALLAEFLSLADSLAAIPIKPSGVATEPCWHNAWFFGLDAVALYSLLALRRPRLFLEVGSGNSTMFARRAIRDHDLGTRIVSIDPEPRADIEAICDEALRVPLEDVDPALFDRLQAGDIFFLDGSHYTFMNSDATVALLEILPRLPAGVLVQVHDIFLPYDYLPEWVDRYYTEQYVLAPFLLAERGIVETLMPNFFVYSDPELAAILAPLWDRIGLTGYERAGHSYWLQRT